MGRRGARGIITTLALAGVAVGIFGCGGSTASDPEPPAVDAPAAPPEFYGIATQAPLAEEELARMRDGGVGTLRAFFAWQALDPSAKEGDYDWASTDATIGAAAAHGIEVFPYLFSTPEWVAKLDDPGCDPEACAITAPAGPESLEAWRQFVVAAVERYGRDGEFWKEHPELEAMPIRRWQIWNEQNSPSAYAPAPDPQGYAELLAVAAEEIRSRDPEADIVLGGMFGTPFHGEPPALTAEKFLDELYATPGAADNFDGISSHPYAGGIEKVEAQIDAIEAAVERAGDDDADLFITEIGWSSAEGNSPLERGLDGQAENLTTAYELFLENRDEWNLVNVTWYSWRDYTGAVICEWCAESGLFEEEELTPKPAWDAFAALPRS